ncbi:MAG: hypothetical protein ACYC7K_08445 [Desulfobacteria bacterium]
MKDGMPGTGGQEIGGTVQYCGASRHASAAWSIRPRSLSSRVKYWLSPGTIPLSRAAAAAPCRSCGRSARTSAIFALADCLTAAVSPPIGKVPFREAMPPFPFRNRWRSSDFRS